MRKHLQPAARSSGGGETWFAYPELPTPQEIMSRDPVRPLENHPNATYATNKDYFEVQWRLLRHDGVEPLRRAVQGFRANPAMNETLETCIYDEVHCCGINVIRLGIFGRFVFSAFRSRDSIDWIKTERLTPGTCVALSPAHDNFDTLCFPAVVVGKDCRDATGVITPVIDLEFEDPEMLAKVANPNLDLVMVEARSNYYEAVRHVMIGLNQAVTETTVELTWVLFFFFFFFRTPLVKYLTSDTTGVGFPATMTSSSRIDISALVSTGEKVSIPARGRLPEELSSVTGLDSSQLAALQRMLAADLAIVQGPPGTGKTFTSMATLKVLLDIQTMEDPPIIVTAQKNDTIDDILSRLIKTGVKVVRLGGQSKDDEIERSSLLALRSRVFKKPKSKFIRKLDDKRDQLRICMAHCFPSERPLLIRPSWLRRAHLITESQHASMLSPENTCEPESNAFATWLDHEYSERDPHPSLQIPHGEPGGGHQSKDTRYDFLEEDAVRLLRRNKISHRSVKLVCGAQVYHQREMDSEAAGRMAEAELKAHADLWDIAPHKRSHVYEYLEKKLISWTRNQLLELINEIKLLINELKLERLIENFSTLKYLRPRVIGCTTTGLTKYRALLAAAQPRVMIVEEAAETREANIAAALLPSLQQLVLVGDHLQLTPHADVLELGMPPFNLNISLFQRLVERGVDYTTLLVQRRMTSPIRMVLNAWYPGLQDHPRVHQLPPVPGMGKTRTVWLDHQEAETRTQTVSMCNNYEAMLIVVFAHYLVLNGTDPSKITVLSFYSGQKMLIQDMYSGAVLQKGLEIQTVDGYQGKENDVVLLSVTRSSRDPRKPSVGFLGSLNRAIVALSRARLLNVVFGNMANLLSSATAGKTWAKVADGMREVRSTFMPLVCVAHNRKFALHAGPMTWEAVPAMGCGEVCGMMLPCGHACRIKCHPRYTAHSSCRKCHRLAVNGVPCRGAGMEFLSFESQTARREAKQDFKTWRRGVGHEDGRRSGNNQPSLSKETPVDGLAPLTVDQNPLTPIRKSTSGGTRSVDHGALDEEDLLTFDEVSDLGEEEDLLIFEDFNISENLIDLGE
ncbi:hypothetical protein ACRALDRAFT_1048151 [Sodiomyces alcalophilus JCM 7366]|uniref:uncharacterized protein n=1 Tax=Sodiomyces alcalophilus JCM 7366 TaxID=591952 RepID=UPI0039B3DB7D